MQVATGWNSTFHMMAHLVEQKDAVSLVLASTDSASNLTLYKWRTAADYCKTLQPCEEATSLMSGSRHSTLSMIIPVLNILHKKVRDVSDGLADIRWALTEGLNNRWPQCEKCQCLLLPALLICIQLRGHFQDSIYRRATEMEAKLTKQLCVVQV